MKENFKLSAFGLAKGEELVSDDFFGVKNYEDLTIAVMCDGVGSALGGREAAKRVVDYMLNGFKNPPKSWDIEKSVLTFIENINKILYQEGLSQYERAEFLTTLSMVIIVGNRLYGANVGDSPIYLLRDHTFQKLSFDHTIEEGSNILTQAVGMSDTIQPYFFENFIRPKDRILLSSDGLFSVLSEEEVSKKVKFGASLLVKYASEKAKDNLPDDVSAIVIEVKEIDPKIKLKKQNLPIPSSLKKDQAIDGYLLLKPLAKNNRTWLAEKKGIKYVMKFPSLECIDDESALDLFVKEAWNANRLKAGFFPKAVIPKNRTARYYIMEYIEGKSLKEIIKKRTLHVDEAINLAKFLLKASSFLLKRNLVHGDIKPENIMVFERKGKKVFKLVDFGSIVEIFSITNRAGTPSYLSPERFKGGSISESSEIFAIGVTLYEALSKKLPYGEIEPFQNPVFKKPKRLRELNKAVPEWFEAVIMRAIEIDVQRRYAHYSEMDFELNNPSKVKPYFDPNASIIEKEPVKVYKTAFIISFVINLVLIFLLIS